MENINYCDLWKNVRLFNAYLTILTCKIVKDYYDGKQRRKNKILGY